MKKALFLLLALSITAGCAQIEPNNEAKPGEIANEAEAAVTMDWLVAELTQNFAERGFTLAEMDSVEIGQAEDNAKVLGFSDSGVSVKVYDRNHEAYGTQEEFEDAISRYSTGETYGEDMLQEKEVHPSVSLQYTKSAVMANHGAMKREYFFTLANGEMLKVKVAFPADTEMEDEAQKELIRNKVEEVSKILVGDL